MNNFIVIGGDERYLYAADYISQETDCSIYGFCEENVKITNALLITDFNKIFDYPNIIFPLPVTRDDVNLHTPLFGEKILLTSLTKFSKQTKIYAGMVSPRLKKIWSKYEIIDYYDSEFAIINTIPTVEGVIGILIKESNTTISDMNILVVGGGRTAKSIVRLLSMFSKNITVTARNPEQLAFMKTLNVNTVMLEKVDNSLPSFDTVINTVPAKIFDLNHLKHDCLLLDISTCGLKEFVPEKLHYFHALNIPGNYSPKSAGKIIANSVLKNIRY